MPRSENYLNYKTLGSQPFPTRDYYRDNHGKRRYGISDEALYGWLGSEVLRLIRKHGVEDPEHVSAMLFYAALQAAPYGTYSSESGTKYAERTSTLQTKCDNSVRWALDGVYNERTAARIVRTASKAGRASFKAKRGALRLPWLAKLSKREQATKLGVSESSIKRYRKANAKEDAAQASWQGLASSQGIASEPLKDMPTPQIVPTMEEELRALGGDIRQLLLA